MLSNVLLTDGPPLALAVALLAVIAVWKLHTRAQQRLHASEERHGREAEAYLDVAGVLLLALDRDGDVKVANRMLCEMLGRSPADLVGAEWVAAALPASDQAEARAGYAAVMAGAQPMYPRNYENRLVDGEGRPRLVRWTSVPVHDEDGALAGLLTSGEDITARREAELELAQSARDLTILRDLAQAVAARDDAREAVVAGVRELTDAHVVALLEPSADGEALQVTATTLDAITGSQIDMHRESSGSVIAFRSGQPFFVADVPGHPAVNSRLARLADLASALFQPVLVDGRAVAVLIVGWSTRVGVVDTRQTDLVAVATDEAAIALQRLWSTRRLEEAALTDTLTGVANRRAFDQALDGALADSRRSGHPLTLALIDLNAFKALNDSQGHEAGDRLLKAAAAAWTSELRLTDLLARVGGDEFAVLLPNCAPEAGDRVSAKLHTALPHAPGCGIGRATWDGREDPASLLRRADQALYADKARGRSERITDPARLRALDASGLMDHGVHPELDEIARAIAFLLDVPVALVSMVAEDRQHFAGQHGLGGWAGAARGTPLSHSFCQHAVATGRPLIVADAHANPLVATNGATTELGVAAYAGLPLTGVDGQPLGAVCAIDTVPRTWTESDLAVLRALSQRLSLRAEAAGAAASR